MFLVWRNLLQSETRLMGGLRRSVYHQIAVHPKHAPGSVVIAQKGMSNLLTANSLLPPGAEQAGVGHRP